MYFDDLPVGFTYETGETELSEAEIIDFARQFDPQPFHVDPEAAAKSTYGGIIASGFQTLSIAFRQTLEANIWNEASMGSPGIDELRWRIPVRPGDRLRTRGEVIGSRPSGTRDDRGYTEISYEVLNQRDEVVASYRSVHILMRRPAE